MSAGAPAHIHTITIDYRDVGSSTGTPSEEGLLIDAMSLAEWAIDVAAIPPTRIFLFGQSLGTAVAVSLAHHLATASEPPVLFCGMVLVAPMANMETPTATYRVSETIPLLDSVARFPKLLTWFNTFITSKWPSKDKLEDLVRQCEQIVPKRSGKQKKAYHITIIHAEDDYDIPWSHSELLFWHGVNATMPSGISFDDLEEEKRRSRVDLGAGGWVVEQQTERGVIREHIAKHGLHDRIMSYLVVSNTILRAFGVSPRLRIG